LDDQIGIFDGSDRLALCGDVSGAPSIAGRAFEALKRAIVELRLRPGDSISEAEVARELGISRQPVREAFIKLAEVGLIEIRPKRGTFVRLISRREVENARFIREAIEVAVVRKAAADAPDETIAELGRLIDLQVDSAAAGDLASFHQLDDRFHRAIAEAADCEDAWKITEDLKVQFDRARFLSLPHATPLGTLVEQHRRIAQAIANRDADAAEEAMRRHLSEVLTSLPKIAAEQPALFVD
jgi:DNA-binding GntR family transcriptional regulator